MYYALETGEVMNDNEMVACHLRQGGVVVEDNEFSYSHWMLESPSLKCIRADYVKKQGREMCDQTRFMGDDPWFARGVGVITPGISDQMKEVEREVG